MQQSASLQPRTSFQTFFEIRGFYKAVAGGIGNPGNIEAQLDVARSKELDADWASSHDGFKHKSFDETIKSLVGSPE